MTPPVENEEHPSEGIRKPAQRLRGNTRALDNVLCSQTKALDHCPSDGNRSETVITRTSTILLGRRRNHFACAESARSLRSESQTTTSLRGNVMLDATATVENRSRAVLTYELHCDLYGEVRIEDLLCTFTIVVESYPNEPYSWGQSRGVTHEVFARLLEARIGKLLLIREQLVLAFGLEAIQKIEDHASETYIEHELDSY